MAPNERREALIASVDAPAGARVGRALAMTAPLLALVVTASFVACATSYPPADRFAWVASGVDPGPIERARIAEVCRGLAAEPTMAEEAFPQSRRKHLYRGCMAQHGWVYQEEERTARQRSGRHRR